LPKNGNQEQYKHDNTALLVLNDYLSYLKTYFMLLKQAIRPLKSSLLLSILFLASITLRSQEDKEGSMTQFYIVSIVFTVLVVGGVLSFFISNKKKRD
jgi:hypothetical protein